MFWDVHRVHKIILWDTQDTQGNISWAHPSMKTDPGTQYSGTSTSLQKKNVSPRPAEQEMARIAPKLGAGGCVT